MVPRKSRRWSPCVKTRASAAIGRIAGIEAAVGAFQEFFIVLFGIFQVQGHYTGIAAAGHTHFNNFQLFQPYQVGGGVNRSLAGCLAIEHGGKIGIGNTLEIFIILI